MSARWGEQERRMEEKVHMATNRLKRQDQQTGGGEYSGDKRFQELRVGLLRWSTMEVAIKKEESEHGVVVRRVAIVRKKTNEGVHWRPLFSVTGQWLAQTHKPE
ncbi:hypothetical protein PIB30_073007, partial [Stylosanthes scabra]|nr:hypothetical protein [Stylosanthes scabra]